MSNFPISIDTNIDLPQVVNNITEIGGEAINALRDAVLNIENEIGLGGSGTSGSIATRLGVSINPDGSLKNSALIAAGLIALPITNAQIAPTASIDESKINLVYATSALKSLIDALNTRVLVLENFNAQFGYKIEPHIEGVDFNHLLGAIHADPSYPFLNQLGLPRPTTNAATQLKDLNDDFVSHQRFDNGRTLLGTVAPTGTSHYAYGIALKTQEFQTLPQSLNDVQKFADFVDTSSLLLMGSRIQNFYSNGIPRDGRLNIITNDGYAEQVVEVTPVQTYLLYGGGPSSTPIDDIDHGDDLIEFMPTSGQLGGNNFDSQFSNNFQ
jgi:hypothetical protein